MNKKIKNFSIALKKNLLHILFFLAGYLLIVLSPDTYMFWFKKFQILTQTDLKLFIFSNLFFLWLVYILIKSSIKSLKKIIKDTRSKNKSITFYSAFAEIAIGTIIGWLASVSYAFSMAIVDFIAKG